MENQPTISSYPYRSHWEMFALATSINSQNHQVVGIGSNINDLTNYISLLQLSESGQMEEVNSIQHRYPASKILFSPNFQKDNLLASSGELLNILKLSQEKSIIPLKNLQNSQSSIVTSFDWNPFNCNMIVAVSLDTSYTIWDIQEGKYSKKMFAHSSQVSDISFSKRFADIFVTAGSDKKIQIHDIRNPQTCYKSHFFSNYIVNVGYGSHENQHVIGALELGSKRVVLMDQRKFQLPLVSLKVKNSDLINGFTWSRNGQYFCTFSDNHYFIWNLRGQNERRFFFPQFDNKKEQVIFTGCWQTSKLCLGSENGIQVIDTKLY